MRCGPCRRRAARRTRARDRRGAGVERAERARLRIGVRGACGRAPGGRGQGLLTTPSLLTQPIQLLRGATQALGATRARLLKENLGDFAPSEVVAPRSDGAARTAKYQAALDGGHDDVLVLISEVWGGFSPEAMRFLGELAGRRGTTALTSSARARRGRRRRSPPTTAGRSGDQGRPGRCGRRACVAGAPKHRQRSCRSALADGVERRSTAVVRGLSVYSRRRPNGSLRPVNRSPPPHPPLQSASEGIGGARGLGNLIRPESHPEPVLTYYLPEPRQVNK